MPQISINLTEPLDILGVLGIALGVVLILGGLGILRLGSVHIPEGRRSWVAGIVVAVLGVFCLWLNGSIVFAMPRTAARGVPVILDIRSHDSPTTARLLDADIHFRDDDGDANRVTYELISTTAKNVQLWDDPFTVPAEEQKAGAVVTIHWNCQSGSYVVKLNAIMEDLAGNRSNKVPFVLNCP